MTISAETLHHQEIPHISKEDLENQIKAISKKTQIGNPFYILDLGEVERLIQRWNQSLPLVKPFYAVKCNTHPALLFSLAKHGTNFDCASPAEIQTILDLGVCPSRIVYANPCKAISHIDYAAKVGVNLTTFDSTFEVDKIKELHPNCALLLRLKILNDKSSFRPLGTKFGALPEEVEKLLKHAKNSGLRVVGVSFHVGSIAKDPTVYREAIAAAKATFNAASRLQMDDMRVLNIGGGFRSNPLFEEIAKTINGSINEFFPNHMNLTLIAEPGRFFAETAFTLVTNVIGKRIRGDKMEYWIDDGIYGSFNLPAYDRTSMKLKPLLLNRPENGLLHMFPLHESTIFGPSCDSLDLVVGDNKLPEMEMNDLIVFYNMGAYTNSVGTKFNGFNMLEIPSYVLYTNKS